MSLSYVLEDLSEPYTIIVLPSGKTISFPDIFFATDSDSLYCRDNLPQDILWIENDEEWQGERFPVFYADAEFTYSTDEVLIWDLVGVLFFCLSRWEESLNYTRDRYDRFIDENSFLVKQSIHLYPIVDYCELYLRSLFDRHGLIVDTVRQYELVSTHDVDIHRYFRNSWSFLSVALGDLIHRKNIAYAWWTLTRGISHAIRGTDDPWDTDRYMLEEDRARGATSIYYYIPCKKKNSGASYHISDDIIQKEMEMLGAQDAVIGVHPSLSTYRDPAQLSQEVTDLRNVLDMDVHESRQHFLQWIAPDTIEALEQVNIKIDSSLHFRKYPGYRCGTSVIFPLWNSLQRRASTVYERPLLFMDQNFHLHPSGASTVYEQIQLIIKRTKVVSGNFVMLWHNSSFNHPEWKEYQKYFTLILQHAA